MSEKITKITIEKADGEKIDIEASHYTVLAYQSDLRGIGAHTNMAIEDMVYIFEQLKFQLLAGVASKMAEKQPPTD